jgi:hypothetical protein
MRSEWPAGPDGVRPLQNARIADYHVPSPYWLFIRGIFDQPGRTAADDGKKLRFQMNVFWLKP